MGDRIPIPKDIETEVLHLSARRCCLCYGVDQDLRQKDGQIAHLDHDPSNNKPGNLAFLCLKHHNAYDGKTSQSKNYQMPEIKRYREELFAELVEKRIRLEEGDIVAEDADGYYERFSQEYIGRDENVKHVMDFLNSSNEYFMLLYGVGGMGKSHLLSECRERFDDTNLIHRECDSTYDLKKLFRVCKIAYPEKLTEVSDVHQFFLDEFCNQNLTLILDDFYEIIDKDVRSLLPKLVKISKGKILLVSRIIPKELSQTGLQINSYEIPALDKEDFETVIRNYILAENKIVKITDGDIVKIYDKARGYPLGGQLIVDLIEMGEKLEKVLNNLPEFEAQRDPDGKEFSGRLLDNIFEKGNSEEINLLCEFSALYEAASIDVIKQLPSFEFRAFEALVKRRRFIQKEVDGSFHCHAMIKDFAYEKLSTKEAIHSRIGKYYEHILFSEASLNSEILFKTINHYKRIGTSKLRGFGRKVDGKYGIADVKSLIEDDIKNTIRNYESLLEVYPEKAAYGNELGMAYRKNNQKQLAIDTFLKVIKENDAKHVHSYNELGITYRENNQIQLAVDTFLKVIEEIDPKNVASYNELGITYQENRQGQLAIDAYLKGLKVEPESVHILNGLGIFYRKINQIEESIDCFKRRIEIEPDNPRPYNQLGTTYRESNRMEEAIRNCERALSLGLKSRLTLLNLLQIFLFFKPDKAKAKTYFDKLDDVRPAHGSFKNRKGTYKLLIENLDDILNMALDDLSIYHKYVFAAIQYRAYHTVVPLLFELDKKYPENLKIISGLAKTLCDQRIGRHQEGQEFFIKAIKLLESKGHEEQLTGHIFFYLRNLLYTKELKLFKEEIKRFKKLIDHLPAYFQLLGNYYEQLNEPKNKILASFEKAIELSLSNKEKASFIYALLNYLTYKNEKEYEERIEQLKERLRQIQ